jgi:hypothetical protein
VLARIKIKGIGGQNALLPLQHLILWVLCGASWPLFATAANDSAGKKRIADSSFIRSYYEKLDMGLQFGSQFTEYRTYYNDTFFLAVRPNEIYTLSPSIDYRWLSLSYAFTPEFLEFNNDDDRRGTTRYRRLSASVSFNRFSLTGVWSNTQGFYLNNMDDVYPDWNPEDAYLKFPDLKVRQVQVAGLYRTNPNYSLKAIRSGEEEQLRSAWTFLPGMNFNHFRFTSASADSIIGSTELTDNYDVNLVLAVAGTWVFARHAFLAGTAGPLFGFDYFNSLAYDENKNLVRSDGVRFSSGFYFRLNIGYSNPRWYAGISNYINGYKHASGNDERLAKVFNQFSLFGGFRLNPPKPLTKTLNWVEKILPFLK